MPTSNIQFRGLHLADSFVKRALCCYFSVHSSHVPNRTRLESSTLRLSSFFFQTVPRIDGYSIQNVNYPINYVLF